jgi:hypothetical protein
MSRAGCLLLSIFLFLSGCASLQRLVHGLSGRVPEPLVFEDEGSGVPVASARFLTGEFHAVGKQNLTLKSCPGADHRLNATGIEYRPRFLATLGDMPRAAVRRVVAASKSLDAQP